MIQRKFLKECINYLMSCPHIIDYEEVSFISNKYNISEAKILELSVKQKIKVVDFNLLSSINKEYKEKILNILLSNDLRELEDFLTSINASKTDINLLSAFIDKTDLLNENDSSNILKTFHLQKYFNEISSYDLLTPEKEKELSVRISNGDKQAETELIQKNLRLVISIAKKYQNRGLSFIDIIMEGNLGLMKAVKKFKLEKGNKFSTYAYCWIIQSITRAIADKANIVRIPVHLYELRMKINKAFDRFLLDQNRVPTTEEIANILNIKEKKINNVLNIKQNVIFLDQQFKQKEGKTFGDVLLSDETPLINRLMDDENQEVLLDIMNKLPDREKTILKMRYNIMVYDKDKQENNDSSNIKNRRVYTLDEIGLTMGVTRERVRQLEQKALNFIRAHYIEYLQKKNHKSPKK